MGTGFVDDYPSVGYDAFISGRSLWRIIDSGQEYQAITGKQPIYVHFMDCYQFYEDISRWFSLAKFYITRYLWRL
jgi:hypothetical protein